MQRIFPVTDSQPSAEVLDELVREINRADSLLGVLAKTLGELDRQDDAPYQVYACSVMAEGAGDVLQSILTKALALQRREIPAAAAEGGA